MIDGAVRYCHLWILGFAEITKPLNTATRGSGPLIWTDTKGQAFQNLKKALTEASALALPNSSKPFHLFVHESQGVAKGGLTQTLGPWRRPVAYLSKRLNPAASGWPSCLRAIAATASLVQESNKLTLGQNSTLMAPHAVETLLRSASGKWMSNAHILQYQSLLLDQPRLTFSPTRCLNPATLLPDPDSNIPAHYCQELFKTTETGRPDLQDVPLEKADATMFTDGSSFLEQGVRKAGAGVTTETDVLWAQALPANTSAQKAELIALTQALRWGKHKRINVYTDSRYAFATVHVHGAIYQERGLLTSAGNAIKNRRIPRLQSLTDQAALRCTTCAQVQDIILPLVREAHPNPVPDQTGPCHSFQPGDLVFVKKFQRKGLTFA
ncbi:uncharacterized protein LOC134739005 [Pongo pygmaeus]|uniref:uncharacterized protein LOC134739005 n=1 Tax=Pongo pygmaeus TaxID=9600 RepID=UPI00300C82CE